MRLIQFVRHMRAFFSGKLKSMWEASGHTHTTRMGQFHMLITVFVTGQ